MNIPFIIDKIRPEADYGSCQTYEDLVRTWRDKVQSLPPLSEMRDAWLGGLDAEFAAVMAEDNEPTINIKDELKTLKARVKALEDEA